MTLHNGHLADARNGGASGSVTPTEDLRREADVLAVSLDGRGSRDERQLLRHIAQLDETLAELGDNLIHAARNRPRPRHVRRDARQTVTAAVALGDRGFIAHVPYDDLKPSADES